jgi:hypothetical protein
VRKEEKRKRERRDEKGVINREREREREEKRSE